MRAPDPALDALSHLHQLPETLALTLVEIIELKWLMVAEGVRVHVERLQTDAAYADHMLSLAAASEHATLRHTALRLRKRLGWPAGR
jgi:hypothetical protein